MQTYGGKRDKFYWDLKSNIHFWNSLQQDQGSSPSYEDLGILLGCVHYRNSTNSSNYINGDQQYVLYYIATEKKVNLPALLFQYLMDMVKEPKMVARR